MSSTDWTAYDSFGRILANGGEQGYAIGVARGYDQGRLDTIMTRRFGDDYGNAGDLLGVYAAGMLLAANRVNNPQELPESLALQDMPNNPFLDSQESGGNIFRWSADVEFEGGSTPVTVYGYSGSADIQQMIDEAIAGGIGIADQYRGKFGLSPDDSINPTSVTFLTLESVIPNGSTSN
jgi:hypothetical protein